VNLLANKKSLVKHFKERLTRNILLPKVHKRVYSKKRTHVDPKLDLAQKSLNRKMEREPYESKSNSGLLSG
jgi:hypothetical protein